MISTAVVKAAAQLDSLYLNPGVAALNRARRAKTSAQATFWQDVFHALYRPYTCQSWTDHDRDTWRQIRSNQT